MREKFVSSFNVLLICLLLTGGCIQQLYAQINFIDLVEEPEARVVEALTQINDGRLQTAREILENLLDDEPDFRLAHLVYADLMLAASGQLTRFGGRTGGQEITSLLEEAKRRYAHQIEKQSLGHNMLPDVLLKVSPSQRRVVVVDSALSRAHVYENDIDGLTLVDDYFATVGENGLIKAVEGDKRTPMGVYFITSRLNPDGLEDLYGDGALPLNYPNEWDQRLGRTGYGIWLHGVPSNTYNRAPYATQGCIALPNADIGSLYDTPDIQDTPVIILPTTNWVEADSLDAQRETLLSEIDRWKSSMLDRDFDRYADFYSTSFSNEVGGFEVLLDQPDKVLSTIAIKLTDISLFKYPGDDELIVSTFNRYRWNAEGESNTRVRQYWQLESDNQWRIVYEGDASYQPVHFRGIPKSVLPVFAENGAQFEDDMTPASQLERIMTPFSLKAIN